MADQDSLRGRPLLPVPDRESTLPVVAHPLTTREFEVLVLLATGLSNWEIAAVLGISPGTVNEYTRRL